MKSTKITELVMAAVTMLLLSRLALSSSSGTKQPHHDHESTNGSLATTNATTRSSGDARKAALFRCDKDGGEPKCRECCRNHDYKEGLCHGQLCTCYTVKSPDEWYHGVCSNWQSRAPGDGLMRAPGDGFMRAPGDGLMRKAEESKAGNDTISSSSSSRGITQRGTAWIRCATQCQSCCTRAKYQLHSCVGDKWGQNDNCAYCWTCICYNYSNPFGNPSSMGSYTCPV